MIKISFRCNSFPGQQLTANICTWCNNLAVVACAKICSNGFLEIWIRAKGNSHHIWIVMEKSSAKWALVPVLLYSNITIWCCHKPLTHWGWDKNGHHFADDTFERIFFNENVQIWNKISLKFGPTGPINNIPALVQIMAWLRAGNKPLSDPMMARLPTHICVTASLNALMF